MSTRQIPVQNLADGDTEPYLSPRGMAAALRERLKLLIIGPLLVGAATLGLTGLVTPIFTATTTFMPPQQAQSAAATAVASLGALAGLAGGGGLRTSGDQYVALLQSVTVTDRIVDRFGLMAAYEVQFRVDARKLLGGNVRVGLGKKDGWITIEVDDPNPQRAADIANRYVEELRLVSSTLAVTEAQQRRSFFEQQLAQSRERLVLAQQALQASGFNPGALKAEPRAAADNYAKLKAEATAAEVRLQALRGSFADGSSEVRQQQNTLAALRDQLARSEQPDTGRAGPDYIGKYRDFKYQETLFDLYARQFELARVDESREGALIQVVDAATPPERKSKPKRVFTAVVATLTTALALMALILLRRALARPDTAAGGPAAAI